MAKEHKALCTCDTCLLRLIQGDNPARGWSAWYKRDRHFLLSFVNRRTYQSAISFLAEDIVQEAFEKAFLNISNGRYQYTGSPLRAYLCGTAKNLIREANRSAYREADDLPAEDTLSSKTFSPELDLIVQEHINFIAGGWHSLRPIQKEILFLTYAEGKDSSEVATHCDLTRENSRVIAMRGVKAIRKSIHFEYGVDISAACIRSGLEMLPSTAVATSL